MYNPELAELPDHEHYFACSTRMTVIKDFCTKTFYYVVLTSIIVSILSFTGMVIPVISAIPQLLSTSFEVPFMFFQVFEMIAMVLLSCLGYGKYKICNVVLLVIYVIMLICGIFSKCFPGGLIAVIIGGGGVAQTFRAVGVYSDFEQLVKTEGYPHFNKRFTESMEKPDYESRRSKYSAPREPLRTTEAVPVAEPSYDSSEMPSISAMPSLTEIPDEQSAFMDEIEAVCRTEIIFTEADGFVPMSFCTEYNTTQ